MSFYLFTFTASEGNRWQVFPAAYLTSVLVTAYMQLWKIEPSMILMTRNKCDCILSHAFIQGLTLVYIPGSISSTSVKILPVCYLYTWVTGDTNLRSSIFSILVSHSTYVLVYRVFMLNHSAFARSVLVSGYGNVIRYSTGRYTHLILHRRLAIASSN